MKLLDHFNLQNKKAVVLYILIFISIWLTSCDQLDRKLQLFNNSKDTVYFVENDTNYIYKLPYQINRDSANLKFHLDRYIRPFSLVPIGVIGNWEESINNSQDSSIYIFFFSKELIKKNSKDSSIVKKQLYSKKVKLKVKDLEKLNWKVTYP